MGLWHSKAGAGAHGTQETDDYMDTSTESPGLASDCEHISPKESTVEAAREVHLLQGAQGITIANSTLRVVGRDSIVHNHHYNVQIEHTKDADPKDVEKLANWLADINFRDIQMENSGKRTPGTGFWVLEKGVFKIWVQGSKEGPRILWGTGMPGAGKTIIASLVVEHLERIAKDNPDVCVVFAFCRYTEPIPVRDILAALLRQLLEDYPSVFPFIKALYDRHHLKKIRPLQHELLNVLQQITTSGLFRSTFFVLDGLDEASAAIQFDLIQVLASISAHFFLTSRPLEQWRDQAPDAEFFTIEAPSSDISLLVEQKISRIPALRKLLENNETLKTEVVAKVLHNSSGMFLVASLYLDMLQSCFSVRDLRRSLEHLPKGIDGMYDSTMEQIASQSGADMALLALTWVTFAERPILLDELPYAVAIDPETCKFDPERLVDSSVLVSLCRGLITVEKDPWGARLRLVHYTTHDYLKSRLATYWSCDPNSIITSACISRLVQFDFHNFDPRKYGFNYPHGPEYPHGAIDKLYRDDLMLEYAHENWGKHARRCEPFPEDALGFVRQCQQYPILQGPEMGGAKHVAAAHGIEEYFSLPSSALEVSNLADEVAGTTPLILALRFWHVNLAAMLLTLGGINLNARDVRGPDWTALMYAADQGYDAVVRILLTYDNIDINTTSATGNTPLILAAKGGHESVVALLCKVQGINVNSTNQAGKTALTLASRFGHVGIVKLLLDVPGIDVNAGRKMALERAVKRGNLDIVKLLLQVPDIDVNKPSSNDHSALARASKHGRLDMVEMLLNHSAIDLNDGMSGRPMIMAVWFEHIDIINRLIKAKDIDINAVLGDGFTALVTATFKGNVEIVQILLDVPGIDVNAGPRSPLRTTSVEVLDMLLEVPNIDVNRTDVDGHTPLSGAASLGDVDLVSGLLEHEGIDVNDGEKKKALVEAASGGWLRVVEVLLGVDDIDVNVVDSEGRTALMAAATHAHISVIQLLLGVEGINVDVEDAECRKAYLLKLGSFH